VLVLIVIIGGAWTALVALAWLLCVAVARSDRRAERERAAARRRHGPRTVHDVHPTDLVEAAEDEEVTPERRLGGRAR
jgi:hypothetical protein